MVNRAVEVPLEIEWMQFDGTNLGAIQSWLGWEMHVEQVTVDSIILAGILVKTNPPGNYNSYYVSRTDVIAKFKTGRVEFFSEEEFNRKWNVVEE